MIGSLLCRWFGHRPQVRVLHAPMVVVTRTRCRRCGRALTVTSNAGPYPVPKGTG